MGPQRDTTPPNSDKIRWAGPGWASAYYFLGVGKKKLEEVTMQLESGGQEGDGTGYGR